MLGKAPGVGADMVGSQRRIREVTGVQPVAHGRPGAALLIVGRTM